VLLDGYILNSYVGTVTIPVPRRAKYSIEQTPVQLAKYSIEHTPVVAKDLRMSKNGNLIIYVSAFVSLGNHTRILGA